LAEITVERSEDVERVLSRFHITVSEGDSITRHEVTLSAADFERLGEHYGSPEEFVRSCFEFLLEREPKSSILPTFDIAEIGIYFPDFERKILRFG
jgi:hypothetical protein